HGFKFFVPNLVFADDRNASHKSKGSRTLKRIRIAFDVSAFIITDGGDVPTSSWNEPMVLAAFCCQNIPIAV
ncbi:MAG: hypothetical protein IJR38_02480, partial [Selenomonadaceae bacterium]|nr:hypothetical protein [Selenomonadaceae bacterium]